MGESERPSGGVGLKRLPREPYWRDLLGRIAERDESALAELYDETSSTVNGLALRMLTRVEDAEEVTLDVYNQVWRIAGSFDRDRGSVIAWLMTLARSRSLDKIRARTSRDRLVDSMPDYFDAPSREHDPESQTSLGQQKALVRRALAELPSDQRRALELAYFRGMSHSELAEQLGEPLGTVKTRIRLGMMKMRELMQGFTQREAQA